MADFLSFKDKGWELVRRKLECFTKNEDEFTYMKVFWVGHILMMGEVDINALFLELDDGHWRSIRVI